MQFFLIKPSCVDELSAYFEQSDWVCTEKDAGQSHFVGWGYLIKWACDDMQVMLQYEDKQGEVTASLQLNDIAHLKLTSQLLAWTI